MSWHDREFGEALDRPYFVYGTLRPGVNTGIWERQGARAYADGIARVHGFVMHAGRIPFVVRTDNLDDVVIGTLIIPADDPSLQHWLRVSLDRIEGYPSFYDREQVTVCVRDDDVTAWIYTPTSWKPRGPIVVGGNYFDQSKLEMR